MDDNNQNPATGSKGVFPGGTTPNHTGAQNTAEPVQEIQMPRLNIPEQNQPVQPVQPVQQQSVQQQPVAAETNTYIRMETKNPDGQVSGVLEIDLISFRERGQESRYLSIIAVGVGQDGNQSDTTISIDNEEDFKRFKEFVSRLNWND